MSIVMVGSTSGSVTLQEPAIAGTTVLDLPAASGTVMVSGNQPAFYAYSSGSVSFSQGVETKVTLNTEAYDTASCFNTSTSRFTPNVAGYYSFSSNIQGTFGGSISASYMIAIIYKNGSPYSLSGTQPVNGNYLTSTCSAIIYLNGSTDYVELYCGQNNGGTFTLQNQGNTYGTYLCGCLVRTA